MEQSHIDKQSSIMVLEAIRAGIPSRELVGRLPDLRQKQLCTIDEDLQSLEAGKAVKGRVLWGEYGQGKTHFLKQVEKHILAKGYAVSYISLSPDLGLNNFTSFFPALASRVITQDAQIPGLLNKLLDYRFPPQKWDELLDSKDKLSHPLPLLIFESFQNHDSREMIVLYNSLMGKKENLTFAKHLVKQDRKYEFQAMPKFLLRDHYKAFMEFLPLLIQALGYKGWVLLIDELEIIGRMGRVSRLNSYRNLSWLLRLGSEHRLPVYTLAASAKSLQEEVFWGVKKHDANDMPRLAMERGDEATYKLLLDFFSQITDDRGLVLKQESVAKLTPLLDALLEVHQIAIPWRHEPPNRMVIDFLKRVDPRMKPIRQTIRMFIETLDIYSVYGEVPGKFKEKLMELYDFDDTIGENGDDDPPARGFEETPLRDMFES